jgi:hypothetical protein|tara:strand:+ start:186 stop:656 length:471 start_codon:yes stop_codon:yes gene_type:complete
LTNNFSNITTILITAGLLWVLNSIFGDPITDGILHFFGKETIVVISPIEGTEISFLDKDISAYSEYTYEFKVEAVKYKYDLGITDFEDVKGGKIENWALHTSVRYLTVFPSIHSLNGLGYDSTFDFMLRGILAKGFLWAVFLFFLYQGLFAKKWFG